MVSPAGRTPRPTPATHVRARRGGVRPRTARGNHPGASRHPSQEGNLVRRARRGTRPRNPRNPRNPRKFPSWEGCRRRRRGGLPRRAHPPSHPPSLIFDIC
ncbi:MAG: hypothetical protein LBM98_08910 [Oscillospiraceae bacterium]|nr:hypothetical protein [Oscillospiraceae bacterium]